MVCRVFHLCRKGAHVVYRLVAQLAEVASVEGRQDVVDVLNLLASRTPMGV